MNQVNIKDFVNKEKMKLEHIAKSLGIKNKIKLGIIDATAADDAANAIYIKKKIEDFKNLGWNVQTYITKDPESAIKEASQTCSAIIVQEPIAKDAKNYSVLSIDAIKDVDGVSPLSEYHPATPLGIIMYLNECEFDYKGKNAVILGRSNIVGRPIAKMLLDCDMNVTVLHSKTNDKDKAFYLANADLVIAAVGKPGVVTREQCPKAVVIDVGINRVNGKLCGDFIENPTMTTDTIWSTPVPGGVGLLTRLALMTNTLESAIRQDTEEALKSRRY